MSRFANVIVCAACAAIGPMMASASRASTFSTLYAFTGNDDGASPGASLVKAGNALYGTTSYGGRSYLGTVYGLDPATGKTRIIHSFAGGSDGSIPQGRLLYAGGMLYGTTSSLGTYSGGTVFAIDPKTGVETVIYRFGGLPDGSNPYGGLILSGGFLYGTTIYGGAADQGTVFKIDIASGAKTTLYNFAGKPDGKNPYGTLLKIGGMLYGTTYFGGAMGNGTVFRIDPQTGAETTLYSFAGGKDGAEPEAGLIDVNVLLYGTTVYGGTNGGWGTLFSIDPKTRVETTLYSFGGSDGVFPVAGLTSVGGTLYGATSGGYPSTSGPGSGGTIFAFDTATGTERAVYALPDTQGESAVGYGIFDSLISFNGQLYGSANAGGVFGSGAAFALDPGTGSITTLHSFSGLSSQGINAGLINVRGRLYGAASDAGASGLGVLFRVNRNSGATKLVHEFTGGTDGFAPESALLEVNGTFFGTTAGSGEGTIFSLDPATGVETPLHHFSSLTEGNPTAELTNVGGMFYGTTSGSLYGSGGTVFSFNPATGATNTIYQFTGNEGALPKAGLVNVNGILFGTTGGVSQGTSYSTIFKIDPTTAKLTTLYKFTGGADGAAPHGTLVQLGSLLYGTTSTGGPHYNGTVFSIDPVSNEFATIYGFTGSDDGAAPKAGLIVVGKALAGTASAGGAHGGGTVFEVNPQSGAETTLYSFSGGADGGTPEAPLTSVRHVLYGTTSTGGANNRGTVFGLTP